MTNSIAIEISIVSPSLLPPFIPITPEIAIFLANGDPLTFSAIIQFASTIKEALQLTSIYQLGDAIMANVLKRYKHTTTGTSAEELIPAITLVEGERIDSLVAYNPTGSAILSSAIINDGTSDIMFFKQSVPAGETVFLIGGFDKVNLDTADLVNVQSATLGVLFYASTVIGVDVP